MPGTGMECEPSFHACRCFCSIHDVLFQPRICSYSRQEHNEEILLTTTVKPQERSPSGPAGRSPGLKCTERICQCGDYECPAGQQLQRRVITSNNRRHNTDGECNCVCECQFKCAPVGFLTESYSLGKRPTCGQLTIGSRPVFRVIGDREHMFAQ